jgi:proline dehydrogenase
MSRRVHNLLSACVLPLRHLATRAYVAGPTLPDALKHGQRLRRRGSGVTIGYWTGDEDTPPILARTYREIVAAMTRARIDGSISIKAAALAFDRRLTMDVVEQALASDIGVHFDSRALELSDSTFELVSEAARRHPRIGCTLPGRWRRSVGDADRIAELGVDVRVVKGEWTDPDDPEADRCRGFLAVIDRLRGRARHVAVATHDMPLARAALERLLESGTHCELQLLFGLPMRRMMRMANDLGVPVTVYVPYGHSRVPYPFSSVRHNPRVLGWIARDVVFGRTAYLLK